MSRGELGAELLSTINKELPDLDELYKMVLSFSPGILPMGFPPDSDIPVASVCLQDATHTLADARYALHEIFAHRIWYLEKREVPNERAAIHFMHYYADDAALRLYAAGEHLANAIVCMLEISKNELKPYEEKRVSKQAIAGNFLAKEKPHHPITKSVLRLRDSSEWQKTRRYRDVWVHEQPPTIKGAGIVYERRNRWEISDSAHVLNIGGGDEPKYSVNDLLRFVQLSVFLFAEVLTEVVQSYARIVEDKYVKEI